MNHAFIPTIGVLIGESEKHKACAAAPCEYRPIDTNCGWVNLPLLEILEADPVMPDQEELREELFKFLRKSQYHAKNNGVLSYYKTAEEEEEDAEAFVLPEWPRTTCKVILEQGNRDSNWI
jgi:hypothetical protein